MVYRPPAIGKGRAVLRLAMILGLLATLSAGCAREVAPGAIDSRRLDAVAATEAGVVREVRHLAVGGARPLPDYRTGRVLGAVAGVVAGSLFKDDRARTAAVALGGLFGSIAGAAAERELTRERAVEYVVALDDGRRLTVVQQAMPAAPVGTRVFVEVDGFGDGLRVMPVAGRAPA